MSEMLSMKIATEYQEKVKQIPENGGQDIGARRKLRTELQNRCKLTELQALNILNGFHVKDYIGIAEIKEREHERDEGRE